MKKVFVQFEVPDVFDCQFRTEGTLIACHWRTMVGYADIKFKGDARTAAYTDMCNKLKELAGGDLSEMPRFPPNVYPLAVLAFHMGEIDEPKPNDSDTVRIAKIAVNAMRRAVSKTLESLTLQS